MAKEVVKNLSLFVNGLKLASYVNQLEFMAEADKVEVTNGASAGWEESLQGIRRTSMSAEIFLEASGDPEATLHSITDGATSSLFAATKTYPPAAGDVAWFVQCLSYYMTKKFKVGEAYGGPLKFNGSSTPVRGVVLDYNTITSSGAGTAYNFGALGAGQKLYVATMVVAVSGSSPTLDRIIQSDTVGFPSPLTRITVPQKTAVGFDIQSIDGDTTPLTDTYYRVSDTIGGTGSPSFEVITLIGIAPKN